MRIISVNVGLPRGLEWRDETVETGIVKEPVEGPVRVARLNLEGDRQADLTVHGGVDKAVYVYPSEHYAFWRQELPGVDLPWGFFGENVTSEGLFEGDVHIGDRIEAGSARFTVTQPRMPCFKLAFRFRRLDMPKRLLKSGRTGFYVSVQQEGAIEAGEAITLIAAPEATITVADISSLYVGNPDQDLLRRASELTALPESWRDYFRGKLRAGF